MTEHYQRPDWFTEHLFNPAVAALTRLGLSVAGSRVLEVAGRTSGEPRRTPVNVLVLDGERYLVAPRGRTQWVRNLRVSGEGRLILGRQEVAEAGFSEQVAGMLGVLLDLAPQAADIETDVLSLFVVVGPPDCCQRLLRHD